jgi:hypothetical protein
MSSPLRNGHFLRALDLTQDDLFWIKVDADGDCWVWRGAVDRYGYGKATINHVRHIAHRVAYELMVGPIPEGLTLDHLCRNTLCVNPDHLDPVTNRVNIQRAAVARSAAA